MAEYVANAETQVALNDPVIFTASIPCTKGYVWHVDESGIFILKGKVTAPNCFARYQVTFNGNIALPAGATVNPISIAIAISGEPILTSKAIFTPAAAEDYGNVTSTAIITVPRGCCFNVSVENTSDVPTGGTAPSIDVQNANLTVTRIA
jgi:hypothetical protein